MGSEELALLRAVLRSPDDDLPRLVLADWWDEHGQHERAEFCRVQCELARLEVVEFETAGWEDGHEYDKHRREVVVPILALRRRERELWAGLSQAWVNSCRPLVALHLGDTDTTLSLSGVVRRGLVSSVACTADAFLRHAGALFAGHPVTEVRLTDRSPAHHGGHPESGPWSWGVNEGRSVWPHNKLPRAIFALLPPGDLFPPGPVAGQFYRTQASALSALSAACVSHGRRLAGLASPARPPRA